MNAKELAVTSVVDGIPAQKLLEGLARLHQLVLVLDGDGHVVWLSNEVGELCETPGSFQVGDHACEIFPDATTFRREFAIRSQLRKQGFLSNMRIEVHNTRGDLIPVDLSILPINADDAEKPLYVAILRQIEGEEPRREDPRSGVRSLAEVLDSAPEAVLAVNERGFITYANALVERLVGQPPERLVDQPIALLLSNASEIDRLVSSLSPGEGITSQDLTLMRADGRAVQVSASASALREGGRIPQGAVLFLRDVTERRSMQAALERKNVELEHCVYSLAHDLRSPLVALLGFSRLLRQDYGDRLDDTGLHFIDRIEQAGRTMEELIHDLLEFSRIGQGGERRSMVDPQTILRQISAEMKPRLEAADMKLDFPDHPPLIYCDRTRLYQVFSNLVGNAIEHMGSCENRTISVEVWNDRIGHQIAVRDRGRGVEPGDRERIFEVFQSVGPRSDGRRGSGIGLAIVKKIAETHGGRVWVESEPGRGANFRLTFPHR